MAPPAVIAVRRAARRPLMRPLTRSRWTSAPRRPRRVTKPSATICTTSSKCSRASSRYGYAPRQRSNSSSSDQDSHADSATVCCASTSSGCGIMTSRSSSPSFTARRSAAHSTRSSRESGNRRPLGVPRTVWPDRPTRCRKVEIHRGEPIWHTRSTCPMSIPSSSDAVATSAFRLPARSRSSALSRASLERLPWWAVTASSPSRSVSRAASRSAIRRVLTKTSVVLWASIDSVSRS